MTTYKKNKNLKNKPMVNSSSHKNYVSSKEKNNKENLNNKDMHQNLSDKKFKTNCKLSLSNSSSMKNKNTKKFMDKIELYYQQIRKRILKKKFNKKKIINLIK